MSKSRCKHPDGKTLLQRKSCGCRTLKCYVCSMEVLFRCPGDGDGWKIVNRGRKGFTTTR